MRWPSASSEQGEIVFWIMASELYNGLRVPQSNSHVMPYKYSIILALLVIVPLLAFFLLGRRLVEADELRTRRQFEALLNANLAGVDGTIKDYFEAVQSELLDSGIDPSSKASIRDFVRNEPLVEQVLLIREDGTPMYPEAKDPFLRKVGQLIQDRTFGRQRLQEKIRSGRQLRSTEKQTNETYSQIGSQPVKVIIHPKDSSPGTSYVDGYAETTSAEEDHGWFTWYWGNGIQLMHWQVLDDHRTLVFCLNRSRWISEVKDVLPKSDSNDLNRMSPAQVRLVNAAGDVVYFWGGAEIPMDLPPVTQVQLSSPLRPWRLQHFGPIRPLTFGRSSLFIHLLGTGVLFFGLVGLAVFLGREIGRQTREARQRVNFVNQVSHELKTPLTNIRMYAELLESDLDRIDPEDNKAQAHLAVITSESSRLSRLINNVLTFARTNRDARPVARLPGTIDRIVERVLDQFRPSLTQLDIEVVLDLDATQKVAVDADAVEQMLANLIGNVEKYASDGKHLRIASRQKNGVSTITVSDAGPGIDAPFAKRIFEPFERASDHIVSATGTGIGLSITRTLAKRHGGDLTLVDSAIGATFRLTLQTPVWQG